MYFCKGFCDPGFYCKRGSVSRNNPVDDGISGPCTVGHYCTAGTSFPLDCPPGTYMPVKGSTKCWTCPSSYYCLSSVSNYTEFECPMGHYCPNGTEYDKQYPCPSGTFRNATLGKSVSDCFPCTPGSYCNGVGLLQPTGLCSGGFYCISGAVKPNPTFNYNTSKAWVCSSNMTGKVLVVVKV